VIAVDAWLPLKDAGTGVCVQLPPPVGAAQLVADVRVMPKLTLLFAATLEIVIVLGAVNETPVGGVPTSATVRPDGGVRLKLVIEVDDDELLNVTVAEGVVPAVTVVGIPVRL